MGNTTMEEDPIVKKIIVIGDGACGKTRLLLRFMKDTYDGTYVPTIFETETKHVEYEGKPMELRLWDTAGQEDYASLRPIAYKDTHVVLIAFSVVNRDTFETWRLCGCQSTTNILRMQR